MQPTSLAKPHEGLWKLFTTFLVLGIQSFGGGSSTFALIYQTAIQRRWLSEEEFVRTWALAQISPGINLVKLTVLLGHRLRGWPGLVVACGGLLLPSSLVTVLMTAGFTAIRDIPLVKAAMRGIMPATIGLGLSMAFQMGQPLFARAFREGPARVGLSIVLVASAAWLLGGADASPVLVLLLAGVVAVVVLAVLPSGGSRPEPASPEKEGAA